MCKRSIENQTPKKLISRFKFILYDYFMTTLTAVLLLKRRLHNIAKSPVLRADERITQKLDMGMI